jgi:hypothetical protein
VLGRSHHLAAPGPDDGRTAGGGGLFRHDGPSRLDETAEQRVFDEVSANYRRTPICLK